MEAAINALALLGYFVTLVGLCTGLSLFIDR